MDRQRRDTIVEPSIAIKELSIAIKNRDIAKIDSALTEFAEFCFKESSPELELLGGHPKPVMMVT